MTPATQRPAHEINVAPMIDVLLVLLIIFMMVVPMLRKALDLQLPQPPTRTEASKQVVVLEVAAGGRCTVNGEPVPVRRLGDRLRAIFAARSDKILFVRGDPAARYQEVIDAMDEARGAGVRVLAVAPAAVERR